jgi:hypothetical protein
MAHSAPFNSLIATLLHMNRRSSRNVLFFWNAIQRLKSRFYVVATVVRTIGNLLTFIALNGSSCILTYLITYLTFLITPCRRVLLEKLTGSQLFKQFPAIYATQKFITAFTSARHLFLSWFRSVQSIPLHPTSWRSIFVLSYHLRLSQGVSI